MNYHLKTEGQYVQEEKIILYRLLLLYEVILSRNKTNVRRLDLGDYK